MPPQLLETMKQRAAQGDAVPQSLLGQVYQHGKYEVKKNLFAAEENYKKACKYNSKQGCINYKRLHDKK